MTICVLGLFATYDNQELDKLFWTFVICWLFFFGVFVGVKMDRDTIPTVRVENQE